MVYATIAIVALVVVAIAVIGIGYLMDWNEDRQRPGSTAIKVEDQNYTVETFTDRSKLWVEDNGGTGQAALVIPTVGSQLIEEALLIKFASEKQIEATDDDVKAELAKLLGITAEDPNFDNVFKSELDASGLSEQQYRDMARANVLREKLKVKLQEELPAEAESVHYQVIQVRDQALADDLKAQADGGADFAALATANTTDTATRDKGGDAGWVPRGILPDAQEDIVFGLEPGETAVYPATGGTVYVFRLVEKADSHPVEETHKPTLAQTAYNDWMKEKNDSVEVVNNMDFSNGDRDKIDYVIDNADLTLS
jgi:foldase protein PrsA